MRECPADRPSGPHLRIADLPCRVGDDRAVLGEQWVGSDRGVAREGSDRDVCAAVAHVGELGESADVDELRRPRDPELERRDERLAAGEELRVSPAFGDQLDRVVDTLGDVVVERCGNHVFASSIARQTRSGVAGIWMSFTPRCERASSTALITAGAAAIVPVSPTPFTPSGFVGLRLSVRSSSYEGSSAADGTR